jgi:hypothetical protein
MLALQISILSGLLVGNYFTGETKECWHNDWYCHSWASLHMNRTFRKLQEKKLTFPNVFWRRDFIEQAVHLAWRRCRNATRSTLVTQRTRNNILLLPYKVIKWLTLLWNKRLVRYPMVGAFVTCILPPACSLRPRKQKHAKRNIVCITTTQFKSLRIFCISVRIAVDSGCRTCGTTFSVFFSRFAVL